MASPYSDDSPVTDPKMADLSNRLPYVKLDELAGCNPKVPVKAVTVWRPTKKVGGPETVLTCDVQASWPCEKGSFAHSCGKTDDHLKFELSGSDPSDSLPSRCFSKKRFLPLVAKDISCTGGLAKPGGEDGGSDQRREIAKACGIKGYVGHARNRVPLRCRRRRRRRPATPRAGMHVPAWPMERRNTRVPRARCKGAHRALRIGASDVGHLTQPPVAHRVCAPSPLPPRRQPGLTCAARDGPCAQGVCGVARRRSV